jgi:uncharacterized membrane protein
MSSMPIASFRFLIFPTLFALSLSGQTPPKPAGQAPATVGTTKKPGPPQTAAVPAASQSKHYPILLIASGTEPFWSARIGMKGAERLERAGYPPVTLEPGDIAADDSGSAWTYHARDTGTSADVTVRLSREACSDGMSETKYSFRAAVTHAQIGVLNGCAKIAPEQFPEFKQKNLDDDDPEKKKVVPPAITGFKPPVAVAYLDPTGKVMVARGETAKVVTPVGYQLSLSHDGKRLLFTRDEKGKGRTILLYDAVTGKTTELLRGDVQSAFWSPDDSRIAFRKFVEGKWQVWAAPISAPDAALQLFANDVLTLDGWTDARTVLASDTTKLIWIGENGQTTQTLDLKDCYGDVFAPSSANSFRVNPANPDLLLVSAEMSKPPPGVPVDSHTGGSVGFFLYEVRSKRRVILSPPKMFAQNAEWSRDGVQIFFTGWDASRNSVIYREFWDGSGLKKVRAGGELVVGQ